jgi:hypothetical protein
MIPPTREPSSKDDDIAGVDRGQCSAFARSSPIPKSQKPIHQGEVSNPTLQLVIAAARSPPWQHTPRCSSPRPPSQGRCPGVQTARHARRPGIAAPTSKLHPEPSTNSTPPASTSNHRWTTGAAGGQHDDPKIAAPHHAADTGSVDSPSQLHASRSTTQKGSFTTSSKSGGHDAQPNPASLMSQRAPPSSLRVPEAAADAALDAARPAHRGPRVSPQLRAAASQPSHRPPRVSHVPDGPTPDRRPGAPDPCRGQLHATPPRSAHRLSTPAAESITTPAAESITTPPRAAPAGPEACHHAAPAAAAAGRSAVASTCLGPPPQPPCSPSRAAARGPLPAFGDRGRRHRGKGQRRRRRGTAARSGPSRRR